MAWRGRCLPCVTWRSTSVTTAPSTRCWASQRARPAPRPSRRLWRARAGGRR
ncbi:unnamed protein product, partial [Effrenium voratum]